MVRKKDEEGNYTDFRQCGDYRPLNQETALDQYPLPGIEDIFNQIGGGDNLLKTGPAERVPSDANATRKSGENNILGSQQNSVGVVGRSFWTKECAPLLPKADGPHLERPSFLLMLY